MANKRQALFAIFLLSIIQAEAHVQHHVVGDDRGWAAVTDIAGWASAREFGVGDKLWFAYSATEGNVVEVGSKEEYDSCDVSKPIRMLKEGISAVSLDEPGARYFASSTAEDCYSGLKLHVNVNQEAARVGGENGVLAFPPTAISSSLTVSLALVIGSFWVCLLGLRGTL